MSADGHAGNTRASVPGGQDLTIRYRADEKRITGYRWIFFFKSDPCKTLYQKDAGK